MTKGFICVSHYRTQVTKNCDENCHNKLPLQNATINYQNILLQQIRAKLTTFVILLFIFLMVNDANVHKMPLFCSDESFDFVATFV